MEGSIPISGPIHDAAMLVFDKKQPGQVANEMSAAIKAECGDDVCSATAAYLFLNGIMIVLNKMLAFPKALRAVRLALNVWFNFYEGVSPLLEMDLDQRQLDQLATDGGPVIEP